MMTSHFIFSTTNTAAAALPIRADEVLE